MLDKKIKFCKIGIYRYIQQVSPNIKFEIKVQIFCSFIAV